MRRKEVKLWTTRNDAEGGRYELYDLTRGSFPGNTTRSNHNSAIEKHKASHTISSPTNSWGNNQQYSPTLPLDSETAETPAVDVAWGLQQVWDLLKNIFNHAGIDGNGTHLRARVHFDVNYTDAKFVYKYQTAYFGDGVVDNDPEKTIGPNISLSTVSHEIGHGPLEQLPQYRLR
jgi:zinc metalloprotease ZmpA